MNVKIKPGYVKKCEMICIHARISSPSTKHMVRSSIIELQNEYIGQHRVNQIAGGDRVHLDIFINI